MEANFSSTQAYNCWAVGSRPFLALRAFSGSRYDLENAIFSRLRDAQERTSFYDRGLDPIGALFADVKIPLPRVRAFVRALTPAAEDYGDWQVTIESGREMRTVSLPPLDPRCALKDPESEIRMIAHALALEIHTAIQGAFGRPYRPVRYWSMIEMADVREACARYEEQFRRRPDHVLSSLTSWDAMGRPTIIHWIDSQDVVRSTPVVLAPELELENRVEAASDAYIKANYSAEELVSAEGYSTEGPAARRRIREKEATRRLIRRKEAGLSVLADLPSRLRWRARAAADAVRAFFHGATRILALASRRRRARAEMDRFAFLGLYSDFVQDLAGQLFRERPLSAAEVVERLPVARLPVPVQARVSDADRDSVELVFCPRSGARARKLTMRAARPRELISALVEETYLALQEQQCCQLAESTWSPGIEERPTVIRDLVREYERRYGQAPFGAIVSIPAWTWLCSHGVHGREVMVAAEQALRRVPLYLTERWETTPAFQVVSEKRITRQLAKGELVPLSHMPESVKRSFVDFGLEVEELRRKGERRARARYPD